MSIPSERTAVPLPRKLAASVAPGWCDVTIGGHVRVSLDIGVGETLAVARILRVFDGLRRELSRHLIGRPGVFIGYDSLTLPRAAVRGPQRVTMNAQLLGRADGLHEVQYTAVSVPAQSAHPAWGEPVLARGTGRTLHVGT